MDDKTTYEMQIGVDPMLFRELRKTRQAIKVWYIATSTHGSNFQLIPLKILLRKCREQKNYLGLHDGMNVRGGRAVHVGRPGRGHRTPRTAPRSCRRFEELFWGKVGGWDMGHHRHGVSSLFWMAVFVWSNSRASAPEIKTPPQCSHLTDASSTLTLWTYSNLYTI
jgi:hypothetical protein